MCGGRQLVLTESGEGRQIRKACGGVWLRILLRTGWKQIFCIPGFESVRLGKKTHYVVKAEWTFIFLWFRDFLFSIWFLLYFVC